MVGSERGLWSLDGLPPIVEHRLERQLETDREVALRRRYLSDLAKVLSEIGRVLRTGRHAVLALGPSIISQKRTDAADLIAALAIQRAPPSTNHEFTDDQPSPTDIALKKALNGDPPGAGIAA